MGKITFRILRNGRGGRWIWGEVIIHTGHQYYPAKICNWYFFFSFRNFSFRGLSHISSYLQPPLLPACPLTTFIHLLFGFLLDLLPGSLKSSFFYWYICSLSCEHVQNSAFSLFVSKPPNMRCSSDKLIPNPIHPSHSQRESQQISKPNNIAGRTTVHCQVSLSTFIFPDDTSTLLPYSLMII